jgi:hypothetical protein
LRVDEPERINDDLQGKGHNWNHLLLASWSNEQVLTVHRRSSFGEKARPDARHSISRFCTKMRRSVGKPSSRQRPHLALDRLDGVYDNGHRARVERLKALRSESVRYGNETGRGLPAINKRNVASIRHMPRWQTHLLCIDIDA